MTTLLDGPPSPPPPAPPKNSNEEGGHLIPVKCNELLPHLQGRLSNGVSKQHTSTSQGLLTLLDSGFAQIFRQIEKLSNSSFVAFERVNALLQLDGVAQKRLCLSSLSRRETPLIDPLKYL